MTDDPMVAKLRTIGWPLLVDAADEIERLRRWKAEATEVIARWDDVAALFDDLPLGVSRSAGVASEIERLRAEVERRTLAPGHHHVTVADDGGWHAVPMEPFGRATISTNGDVMIEHRRWRFYSENYNGCPDSERGLWVDAPVQGDDREDGHEHKWRFNGGNPMCGECGEYRDPYVQRVYPAVTDPEDRRPHSRACGVRPHPHGRECSTNCPTCQGGDRG